MKYYIFNTKERNFNISDVEYKKDLSDWARLCALCHNLIDKAKGGYMKNVCKRGHLLDEENLYLYPHGGRECLTCKLIHRKINNAKRSKKYLINKGCII